MSNLVPNNVVALKPNQSPLALTDLTRLAALAPCGREFESVRAEALRALTTHGIPSALHELLEGASRNRDAARSRRVCGATESEALYS
jgi:HEAT repeat protein